jgi:GST-like protein
MLRLPFLASGTLVLAAAALVPASLAGKDYTIADIITYPWYGGMVTNNLYKAAEFLAVHEYTNVVRWANQIAARPAVKRGMIVNKFMGDGPKLKDRHSAADIDALLK